MREIVKNSSENKKDLDQY